MITEVSVLIVSLEEAKQYLRIDGDEEDALITTFVNTAEELCENILRYPIAELTVVPEAVKQSVLYAAAQFFEQRENVDIKTVVEIMTRFLFAYRREGW